MSILPHAFNGRTISTERSDGIAVPSIVKETKKPIGGIGMTLRWSFRAAAHDDTAPVDVIFSHIESPDAFSKACEDIPPDVARKSSDIERDDSLGCCASVHVSDATLLMCVVIHLHRSTSFEYELDDETGTRECTFDIGVERFDRASWNFWNQTDDTAAPKQSWHKWDFSWGEFEHLPFTWRRLAKNYTEEPSKLPIPLRYHAAGDRFASASDSRDRVSTGDAPHEALVRLYDLRARIYAKMIPARPVVTRSLTTPQSRELLRATLEWRFSRDEAANRFREVFRRYIVMGYTSRLFGPYRQEGNHVGHGRKPRKFRNLDQYKPYALPVRILNQIYQADGTFAGNVEEDQGQRTKRNGTVRVPEKRRAVGAQFKPRKMRNDEAYAAKLRVPRVADDLFLRLGRSTT